MIIILDRDGVINEDSDDYIKSPEEWRPIPGSLEAIVRLKRAGHRVVVASNQSGLARGYFSQETLDAIHEKMHTQLAALGGAIDQIFYCPHHPDDRCTCRKPKPGLLHQIAKQFHADLSDAIFIGDTEHDLAAAKAAHCRAILVKTGKGQRVLQKNPELANTIPVYENLNAVVDWLLK